MKPFRHKTGRWAVEFSAKNSGIGRRQTRYYDTEREALADIREWTRERDEFGRSTVTSEEREWIVFARRQLGKLDQLPEVIAHWKATGAGSITPTLVSEAVAQFKDWQLPRVKERTKSDIRWRLDAFAESFKGQYLHQLHAGDIQKWLHGRGSAWSVRSFWKRLCPLFDHAVIHRWIAPDANPMLLLKAPDVPSESKAVYTGDQLNILLAECFAEVVPGEYDLVHPTYLLPFICLTAFAWMRTSELVRQYKNEEVLCWEDIDLKHNPPRIFVRPTVGKATRRRSGNERLVPITDHLAKWLAPSCERRTGRIVPVLHREFAVQMRKLHADAKVQVIHNGFRRSAVSMYLAAHPETGIGQLARWAGSSEQTIKRHYLEVLTPEAGRRWFAMEPWLNNS
jgi:integrase